ncbi:MAG TPA: hypothetical protein VL147_20950 [Devosia sp.]|nr:hypothetical protein [Devosia sp.]
MEHREETTASPQTLIVLLAFDKGEDGELMPAFEAREMRDEGTAVRTAKELARRHVGIITWSRMADLVNGEFGEPVVLFQHGDVPELE